MWDGTCSDPSNNLAEIFRQASQKWKMMVGGKSATVMTWKPRKKTFTPLWRVSNSHASSPDDALLGLVGKRYLPGNSANVPFWDGENVTPSKVVGECW